VAYCVVPKKTMFLLYGVATEVSTSSTEGSTEANYRWGERRRSIIVDDNFLVGLQGDLYPCTSNNALG